MSKAASVTLRLIRNDARCCHHDTSNSYKPNPLRPADHFGVGSAMKS